MNIPLHSPFPWSHAGKGLVTDADGESVLWLMRDDEQPEQLEANVNAVTKASELWDAAGKLALEIIANRKALFFCDLPAEFYTLAGVVVGLCHVTGVIDITSPPAEGGAE